MNIFDLYVCYLTYEANVDAYKEAIKNKDYIEALKYDIEASKADSTLAQNGIIASMIYKKHKEGALV